jgi:hypothetical protein
MTYVLENSGFHTSVSVFCCYEPILRSFLTVHNHKLIASENLELYIANFEHLAFMWLHLVTSALFQVGVAAGEVTSSLQ